MTTFTHNFFYNMFIWILYMFRANFNSFSGGQLYWGWAQIFSKYVEDINKLIIEEIVGQGFTYQNYTKMQGQKKINEEVAFKIITPINHKKIWAYVPSY